MKKLLVIVAAMAAVLAGCGGAATTPSDDGVTVLVTGAHSGLKDQIEEQYHDQDAFKKIWDMVYEGQKSEPPLPSVDFTKQTVVVYGLGEMKHGGFAVRVNRAEASAGGYAVGILVIEPGENCHNATQETTHPFIVATVPTASNITFDEVKKRDTPACT